jgi:transcriptional regulator with XRE-family HTH domain/tetratricopeptide (TPR) repeat protein
MNHDVAAFAARLAAFRRSAGLSQEELAKRSGLSTRAVSNLERARTRWPYPDTLSRLADALQLDDEARRKLVAAAGRRLARTVTAAPEDKLPPDDGRLVVPQQLPGPVRHFIGREDELAALTELLGQPGAAGTAMVISAIGGTAGVGKTALATHFAHQVVGRFPDGQLQVNLRGFDPTLPPMSPAEAVRLALDALAVHPRQIPASFDAQIGLYRSLLAGKHVLIVLDNAADAGQVRPLLPGSPTCLVIVTSRNKLAGLAAIDGAVPLALDVLTPAEAHDLLVAMLGPARVSAEGDAAAQLIESCGHLPLALSIIAARGASQPELPLAVLATELADTTHRLDALHTTGDPLASVRAVLACSCRHLGAGATRLFRLLGVHPGPDISLAAAVSLTGLPRQQARRHLTELADASLITQNAAGRYSLHFLVRLYAAEQTQQAGTERQAANRRILDHYLHTGHTAALLLRPTRDPITPGPLSPGTVPEDLADYQEAMAWYQAEHQVLIAGVAHSVSAGQPRHAWNIAWTLHDYLFYHGNWHDLLAVWTTALAAACQLDNLALQAKSHDYLARSNALTARDDDADTHRRQALALFRDLGDQAGQAHVHNGLALSLNRRRQHAAALRHAHRALELYTATGHRTGQATAENVIGWQLCELDDYEQSLTHSQHALTLCRELGHRMGEAATMDSLGYAHHHLGHHGEAVTWYQQALEVYRDLGSSNNCRYAEILNHTGDTHHAAGNLQAAATAWEEAAAIFEAFEIPDAQQVHAKLRATRTARPKARQG